MTNSEKLWGGRFTGRPDETFAEFNRSFGFDVRLLQADVRASIAHAHSLNGAGVLTDEETETVTGSLRTLLNLAAEDDRIPKARLGRRSFLYRITPGRERAGISAKSCTPPHRNAMSQQHSALCCVTNRTLQADISLQSALVSAPKGFTHRAGRAIRTSRAQPVMWPHWCLLI